MLIATGVGRAPAPDRNLTPRYVRGKKRGIEKITFYNRSVRGGYTNMFVRGVYKPVTGRKICEKRNICRGKYVASNLRVFFFGLHPRGL